MEALNKDNFKSVISENSLVVVDFFATWCMPCKMLKPIMERVEEKCSEVKFYSVDISENEDIAKEYKIFSVPTLVAFKAGEKIDALVGLNSFDDIIEFIEKCKA